MWRSFCHVRSIACAIRMSPPTRRCGRPRYRSALWRPIRIHWSFKQRNHGVALRNRLLRLALMHQRDESREAGLAVSRYRRRLNTLPSGGIQRTTRSAGAAERKRRSSRSSVHLISCDHWECSRMLGRLWHSISACAHSCYDIGYTGRFREDGRIIEGRCQIVRGISGQHNKRLAGLAQFPRDRLACLAAEVDIENGDIAPRLKPERFCYRRCRPHDLVTGRSKLLADVKPNHKLVLYHKYAGAHDFASGTVSELLSSRSRFANSSSTFDEGQTKCQRSPVGAKSRSTSPSRLDSAIVFTTVEPKPRCVGAPTVGPPRSIQLI